MEIFGVPTQALFGQLLIGLINGSFYALLSLGLAVIFGLLNIINFAHGAQYMMGAFCAYFLLAKLGIGYWWALAIAPLAVGILGMVIERLMLARLTSSITCTGCCSPSGSRSLSRGCSATNTAPPEFPTRCRRSSPAGKTSASCFCRTTARG